MLQEVFIFLKLLIMPLIIKDILAPISLPTHVIALWHLLLMVKAALLLATVHVTHIGLLSHEVVNVRLLLLLLLGRKLFLVAHHVRYQRLVVIQILVNVISFLHIHAVWLGLRLGWLLVRELRGATDGHH